MSATLAVIAGEEIHRQIAAGHIAARSLGPQPTPLGPSGEVFLGICDGVEFYMLSRFGEGLAKTSPRRINDRANLYALKELGAAHVLGWGPAGAVTHNIGVGDVVLPSDVIDQTYLRQKTFYPDSPLGYLRQFPVFCPTLRRALSDVLAATKLPFHASAVAAVREGPRLETPAEVRMLATMGGEIVTHTLVPEVFLARELEMCYAGACYIVNYAETGSRHRPFAAGDLFGGLTEAGDAHRLSGVVNGLGAMLAAVARRLDEIEKICECDMTMDAFRKRYDLPADWRQWIGHDTPQSY